MSDTIGEIIVYIVVSIGIVIVASVLGSISCNATYGDFEAKYGLIAGCRIKPDDKWIPADSYYFKEE